MADVTLTYKGQNILELSESGNKTIKTAGKYCEDNFNLQYTRPGGGTVVDRNDAVRFFDYDGTLLYSYTAQEFLALESMPSNPSHSGLTARGWNWSLSAAKEYVAAYEILDIGQMYITSDHKTHIHVHIEAGRTSPYLGLAVRGDATISWGDDTPDSTLTGTSTTTTIYAGHEYQPGNYIITVAINGSAKIVGVTSNQSSVLFRKLNTGGNTVSDYDSGYASCITKIELGPDVEVGDGAFISCTCMTAILLPATLTNIGSGVFSKCFALKCIVIPDGITKSSSFNKCSALQIACIPASVSSIDALAFASCSSLDRFSVPPSVKVLDDTFVYNSALRRVSLPYGITSIRSDTFRNCYALEHVNIPKTIQKLDSNAFAACYSLQNIEIDSTYTNLTTLSQSVFESCSILKTIELPNTVTVIPKNAFVNCYSLRRFNCPNAVTSIGESAFSDCHSLAVVILADTVTSIGKFAFNQCYNLSLIRFNAVVPASAGSNIMNRVPNDCRILYPYQSTIAYKSAKYYPSVSNYLYIGFYSGSVGEVLPTNVTDDTTLYNLTWYATIDDAVAGTDPITEMVGDEVYCTSVLVSE